MRIDLSQYEYGQPMSTELWALVDYFKIDEDWGDPYKVRVHLIYWLDALREFVGTPFHVHCCYDFDGHMPDSQHNIGNAVDFHADNIKYGDLFFAIFMFPFTGIGYYPYWNSPGFHIDLRTIPNGEHKKIWYRNKAGVYHNINHTNACVITQMF